MSVYLPSTAASQPLTINCVSQVICSGNDMERTRGMLSGDPVHWTNDEVLFWLRETFEQEKGRVDLREFMFYLRFHVQEDRERLTGRDLYRMTYAEFAYRWGTSAAVIFEQFLLQLSAAGYGSHNILGVWQRLQTFKTYDQLEAWKNSLLQFDMSDDESSLGVSQPNSPP